MSESDTMFNERDRRCAAVQLMLSTDPSYDNKTIADTLKMHIWIATNNRDVPRVMKKKFPVTVMVFGMVSSEGHIMLSHIFEVGLKVNTKVYLDVLKSVMIPLVQSGGRWQTLGVAVGLGARPQVQRDPGLASEGVLRLCTRLSLDPLLPRPEPAGLLRFVLRREYHQHDHLQHQSQPERKPSAEYSPSSRRCLWKRYGPSSGSASRRWLRLKAATLNRYQLYYVIKLPELIFSI